MRKLQHIVLSFCLILSLFFYPSVGADAASVSLGVSASTVNIGDKVKVSVTVPENISATIDLTFSSDVLSFSKASADVGVNGSTITLNVGKYSLAASNKLTVTFKAKTSGSASISASVVSAVDNDTAEEVSLSGASTSVTVENKEADSEEKPQDTPPEETTPEAPKSKDNSLKKLKLSSGTLSPSFQYNVTKYTATVGYNVTSVVVSATPSNEKATIVSVTGDGNVELAVGENTIEVVVQAESGVKATYTIVVTRQEEGAEEQNPPTSETDPNEEDTPQPEKELGLEWNGQKLQPGTEVPNDLVPADFTIDTIMINSIEVSCITFANADLKALYLVNEEGTAGFYVYDEVQQSIYPFVRLETAKSYIIVLLPDEATVPDEENYKPCTLSLEGKGVVNAYQFMEQVKDTESTSWFAPEVFYAAPVEMTDFYLLYGMNSSGECNWYVFDSVEGTVQRYAGLVQSPVIEKEPSSEINTEEPESTGNANDLLAKLEAAENEKMIIICIAVFVVAVLIIIIVNLILRGRDEEFFEEESEEELEYDEEYDFEDEEYTKNEKAEDDEVEIEFYEMPQEETVTEDDEMEIEFHEMPQEETVVEDEEMEIEFYEMPQEETVVEDDEVEIEFYEMSQEENLEEDDEIEIEFYEMTEASSNGETKESDEVEVEFYDMEERLMEETIATGEESSKREFPSKIQTVVDEDDDDLEFIELD